jgi:hypothetical protein
MQTCATSAANLGFGFCVRCDRGIFTMSRFLIRDYFFATPAYSYVRLLLGLISTCDYFT